MSDSDTDSHRESDSDTSIILCLYHFQTLYNYCMAGAVAVCFTIIQVMGCCRKLGLGCVI